MLVQQGHSPDCSRKSSVLVRQGHSPYCSRKSSVLVQQGHGSPGYHGAWHAETLCFQVGQEVVSRYGKQLTREVARAGIGKRPLECWAIIAEMLAIEASAQELFDQTEPQLQAKCVPSATALFAATARILRSRHGR